MSHCWKSYAPAQLCLKLSNILLFLLKKREVTTAGIHKMLVRIANREELGKIDTPICVCLFDKQLVKFRSFTVLKCHIYLFV